MNGGLFDIFCTMIQSLPAEAVIKVANLERKMIERDVAEKRPLANDTLSVLTFCKFLDAASRGDQTSPFRLPLRHAARYREIIKRLVEREELPDRFQEQFDQNFSMSAFPAY